MGRIRTVKPEFFRNAKLYDAEAETGLPLRLAFAGLWTAADREGRFRWSPRELKLDCLPFDDVDFSRVLHALTTRGYIVHYASAGVEYGCIPTWHLHQHVNAREQPSVIPQFIAGQEIIDACPTRAPRVNDASATRHDLARGEGKGKEGKGKENNTIAAVAKKEPAKAGAADAALFSAIKDSFLLRHGNFTNWPKETEAIKRIEKFCLAKNREAPELIAQRVLEKFWDLTSSGDKFWSKQPFTPSALSVLFDRVVKEADNMYYDPSMVDEEIPL